jgi:hypothetical protein
MTYHPFHLRVDATMFPLPSWNKVAHYDAVMRLELDQQERGQKMKRGIQEMRYKSMALGWMSL